MKLLCPGYQADSKKYDEELYQPPEDKISKNDPSQANEIRRELDRAFNAIQEIQLAFRDDAHKVLDDMFKVKAQMDAWEKVFHKDFDNHEERIKDLEKHVINCLIMKNYQDTIHKQQDLFNKNRKVYPAPHASWRLYNPVREEEKYKRSPKRIDLFR